MLTLPTAQGSVIVTGNAAGEWYLYGGSITAAVAVLVAFVRRVRAAVAAPPGPPARAGRRGPSAPDAGP